MKENIELKAYFDSPHRLRSILESLSAARIKITDQVDTYFCTPSGALKLRETDQNSPRLIYYHRLNSPQIRSSEYTAANLGPDPKNLTHLLKEALGTYASVRKKRETYRHEACLIHIDQVEQLGNFVEVEAEVEVAGTVENARIQIEKLRRLFTISMGDILPWSYSDLSLLKHAADRWRRHLSASPVHGKVILLDGASGSGKSTLLAILQTDLGAMLKLIPRVTTRSPRGLSDHDHGQMQFVSQQDFRRHIYQGELIEYRDFLFGMSYGLPWMQTVEAMMEGCTAIGLINLGNGPHVKRLFPEATTVLVDAPINDIQYRLISRGSHTQEQLQERLMNAQAAGEYRSLYDHVVSNEDGHLERAVDQLRSIISER